VTFAIEWKCEGCGAPVDDGDGYICLNFSELRAAERGRRAWEAEHRPPEGELRAISSAELDRYPRPAR